MKTSMNALIVSPHADDAEIAMGGSIKYLSSKGWRFDNLVLSQGELAEIDPFNNEREKQAKIAAKLLGIENVFFAGIRDCNFISQSNDIFASIDKRISDKYYDIAFLPWKHDADRDHEETAKVGLRAVRSIPSILYYQSLFAVDFIPRIFVDMTAETYAFKRDALKIYSSQVERGTISLHRIAVRDSNTALNYRHHRALRNVMKELNTSEEELYAEGFIPEQISISLFM